MALTDEEIDRIADRVAVKAVEKLDEALTDEQVEALILDVPDVNDPDLINYWRRVGDKWIYLEGWADACLAGTGFPPMEEGGTSEKVAYMEDLTPGILEKKATENSINKQLRLIRGGFRETEDATFLYGVTWGVYEEIGRG